MQPSTIILSHLDFFLGVLNLHLQPLANIWSLFLIFNLSALIVQDLTLLLTSCLSLHFSPNSGPLEGQPASIHTSRASLLRAHKLLRTLSFHLSFFLPLTKGRVHSLHSTRIPCSNLLHLTAQLFCITVNAIQKRCQSILYFIMVALKCSLPFAHPK